MLDYTLVWDGSRFTREEVTRTRGDGALIQITSSGLCATDIHTLQNGGPLQTAGLMLGHEFGGIITNSKAASSVGGYPLNDGDVVAVVPGVACGTCSICLSFGAHEHICSHRRVHGFSRYDRSSVPLYNGGFSSSVELGDGIQVVRVPEFIPAQLTGLIEPVAIAVRAVERALGQGRPDMGMGSLIAADALVLGGGAIGMAVALVLRACGANVMVYDVRPEQVSYVADRNFDVEIRDISEVGSGTLKGMPNHDYGFDVVLDVTGDPRSLSLALEAVRVGGRVVEVGCFVPNGEVSLDPSLVCRKDIELVGSVLAPPTSYLKAIDLMERNWNAFSQLATPSGSHTKLLEPEFLNGIMKEPALKRIYTPEELSA